MKLRFLLFLLIVSCTGSPAPSVVSKVPITQKRKMSTVVLALVTRQNNITDGSQTYTYADGLVFYFIIYPNQSGLYPAIKQYQNFTINGEPYWLNSPGSYDSHTIIYNEKTLSEQEPEVFQKIKIRKNTNALIQKTIICGDTLPSEGIISYHLFFGFGQILEDFEFVFSLKDLPY